MIHRGVHVGSSECVCGKTASQPATLDSGHRVIEYTSRHTCRTCRTPAAHAQPLVEKFESHEHAMDGSFAGTEHADPAKEVAPRM